jgi:hypothetical protein
VCHARCDRRGANPTGVAIIAEMFGGALDAQEAMKACYSKWEAP